MSSNFSQNNGTIKILTHFLAKNHSKLPMENKNLISSVASVTLHLSCAFEIIKFPNKRVIALFHHFFLQFLHIFEISGKAHNTTTSRPPVPCILQILRTFNLYSGRPLVGPSVNNKQKFIQAMVKISRGGVATPPPPPPRPDMLVEMA